MYIRDGIAYAGTIEPQIKISGVRPLPEHLLWVRFSNGESATFDFKPLLTSPAFAPLADIKVFNSVYIDYGMPVWNDGDIDIAPEYLYEHGVLNGGVVNA